MKRLDDMSAMFAEEAQDRGQSKTRLVFTTDNAAETISFPDGGTTPFEGRQS